jgi:hypothetical protein
MDLKVLAKGLLTAIVGIALFAACQSDVDMSNISNKMLVDQALVFPIGQAKISVVDIMNQIGDSALHLDEREEYFYTDSVRDTLPLPRTELFDGLPKINQKFQIEPITIPSPVTRIPRVTGLPYPADFSLKDTLRFGNLNLEEQRIDSVIIKSMTIYYTLTFTLSDGTPIDPKDITIEMEEEDDQPHLRILFDGALRKSDGKNESVSEKPFEFNERNEKQLENVRLIFFDDSGKSRAYLPLDIRLSFVINEVSHDLLDGNNVFNGGVDLEIEFGNIEFEAIYGKVNLDGFSQEMKIPTNLSETFGSNVLKFANPKIQMTVESDLGSDIDLIVGPISASSKARPDDIVTMDRFPYVDHFTQRIKKPAKGEEFSTTTFDELNSSFGGTDLLFDKFLPDEIRCKIGAAVHEDPDEEGWQPNYISNNVNINMLTKIIVPFYLKEGSHYELQDTILNVGEEMDKLFEEFEFEEAELYLTVENGLPIQGDLKLTLLDEHYDSIPTTIKRNHTIEPAKVGKGGANDGKVVAPVSTQLVINLNRAQVNQLRKTNSILMTFTIRSKDAPSYFTKQNYINADLKIYLKANAVIEM